jgi:hypothetical protein|tara:strand:- start:1320 stop:1496 length:177 start_codon:yes stop_codon:yes gene_type:complete
MTNEELQGKLDTIKTELKKAHEENNKEKIDYYLKGLNELWEIAGKEMLTNAKKDGFAG